MLPNIKKENSYQFIWFGAICVICYILLSFVGRLLFPFGDEPDFVIRAPKVLLGDHEFYSPYYILSSFYRELDINSHCQSISSLFSISSHIDNGTCSEKTGQVIFRWLSTLFAVLPIIIFTIFKRKSYQGVTYDKNSALGLTLLVPAFIYYSGVLAEEQFVLVLSLLVFVFWQHKFLSCILVALISTIDVGNSIVVLFFILSTWFYVEVYKSLGVKRAVQGMVLQVLLCFILGLTVIEYLAHFGFMAGKTESILNAVTGSDVLNKYPLILRPIVTFLTGVFYTPSGVKVYVLFALFGIALTISIWKCQRVLHVPNDNGQNPFMERAVCSYSALATVLSCVFILPGYGNAKYYVFMLPFLIYYLLIGVSRNRIFFFLLTSNAVLFFHLMMYRL